MSGNKFPGKLNGRIVIRAIAGKVLRAKRPGRDSLATDAAEIAQKLPPKPERGRLMAGRLGFIAFKPGKARARRSRGRVAARSAQIRRGEYESSTHAPLSFPPTGKERTPSH